jgi:hypothetical protein
MNCNSCDNKKTECKKSNCVDKHKDEKDAKCPHNTKFGFMCPNSILFNMQG